MKGYGRASAGHARDFAIAPAHAVAPTRAQSLHRRFFGGEARSIALHAVGLGVAIADFALCIDSLQKTIAEARNRLPDARNFGDVNACADDHIFCAVVLRPEAMRSRAAATAASCSGKTVRKSRRTRPSSTRVMMGGSELRKRTTSSSALRPSHVSASKRVGSIEDGAAPPPRMDSPSTISTLNFGVAILAALASAPSPIASLVRRIMRGVGIAS